jgi:hypothetical protein
MVATLCAVGRVHHSYSIGNVVFSFRLHWIVGRHFPDLGYEPGVSGYEPGVSGY